MRGVLRNKAAATYSGFTSLEQNERRRTRNRRLAKPSSESTLICSLSLSSGTSTSLGLARPACDSITILCLLV